MMLVTSEGILLFFTDSRRRNQVGSMEEAGGSQSQHRRGQSPSYPGHTLPVDQSSLRRTARSGAGDSRVEMGTFHERLQSEGRLDGFDSQSARRCHGFNLSSVTSPPQPHRASYRPSPPPSPSRSASTFLTMGGAKSVVEQRHFAVDLDR